MSHRVLLIAAFTLLVACGQASPPGPPDITAQIGGFEHLSGYFDLYWDEKTGRMIVRVDSFDEPFLYQASMARGVGSNDLGLDRGQLGSTKVVRFQHSGPQRATTTPPSPPTTWTTGRKVITRTSRQRSTNHLRNPLSGDSNPWVSRMDLST